MLRPTVEMASPLTSVGVVTSLKVLSDEPYVWTISLVMVMGTGFSVTVPVRSTTTS